MGMGQTCGTIFGFEVIGKRNAFTLFLSFSHGLELASAFGNQLVLVNDGCGLIFCWRI